jgi:hypothetical protein
MVASPVKGSELLVHRLQKGHDWLIANYDSYMDGKLDDEHWYRAFNAWDGLDHMLRTVYGYKGCPIGSNCSEESPIICRSCGDKTV